MAVENSVVWYKIRLYPRWPCKVVIPPDSEGVVVLESFYDHQQYRDRSDKLMPFVHTDVQKMCEKELAMCQRRPGTLEQYKTAIKEAIEFEKSRDPGFCPPAELETLCGWNQLPAPSTSLPSTSENSPFPSGSTVQGDVTLRTRQRRSPNEATQPQLGNSDVCSSEPVSKRKRRSQGVTPTWSKRKSSTNGSTLLVDKTTTPSNHTSESPSASACTKDGSSKESDLNGLQAPSGGVEPHQSVCCEEVTKQASTVGSECSDDDDDAFPSIDMTPQTTIRVKNLRGGDIIWAKYGRYPFWPAMVMNVNKAKMKVMVMFLGWNPDEQKIGIGKKNIALFNYSQQEHFLQQGRSSQWAEEFSLAFEEANYLLQEAVPGTTPGEQLMNVIARRPKNKQYVMSLMAQNPSSDGPVTEDSDEDTTTDKNREDSCNNKETDSSSDEEQVSPEYRYAILQAEFEALKPELLAIVEGRAPSELHKAYCHGSHQQKRAMTQSANFGPARKLPSKQQTQLLSFLENIAEVPTAEQPFGHKYCCEVLFPEAMIRIISKKKGVTHEEAAKEVLQDMDCL